MLRTAYPGPDQRRTLVPPARNTGVWGMTTGIDVTHQPMRLNIMPTLLYPSSYVAQIHHPVFEMQSSTTSALCGRWQPKRYTKTRGCVFRGDFCIMHLGDSADER